MWQGFHEIIVKLGPIVKLCLVSEAKAKGSFDRKRTNFSLTESLSKLRAKSPITRLTGVSRQSSSDQTQDEHVIGKAWSSDDVSSTVCVSCFSSVPSRPVR